MLSLFMQQFPFCFLMLLGYISGIDPSLEKSARMLGRDPWIVFRRVMLPLIAPGIAIAFALVFVMSFAVFPSAIMLGQPAGSTRTIAIAAYHQAFEQYDMSYASAIAVIMGLCQLAGARAHRAGAPAHDRRRPPWASENDRGHHARQDVEASRSICSSLGFILNLLGIVIARRRSARSPSAGSARRCRRASRPTGSSMRGTISISGTCWASP